MCFSQIFGLTAQLDREQMAAEAFGMLPEREEIFGAQIDLVVKLPDDPEFWHQTQYLYQVINRDNGTLHPYLQKHADKIRMDVLTALNAMHEGDPEPLVIPLFDDPRDFRDGAMIVMPDRNVTGRQWAAAACGMNPLFTADVRGCPSEWQYYMAVRTCALAGGRTLPQAEFIATALYRKILRNEDVPQGRKIINSFSAVTQIEHQRDRGFSFRHCVKAISAARKIPEETLVHMNEKDILAAATEAFPDRLDPASAIYDCGIVKSAINERVPYLEHALDSCAMRGALTGLLQQDPGSLSEQQKGIAQDFIYSSHLLDYRQNRIVQPQPSQP